MTAQPRRPHPFLPSGTLPVDSNGRRWCTTCELPETNVVHVVPDRPDDSDRITGERDATR